MTTKTFRNKLEKIIESSNEFVVDTIDMEELKRDKFTDDIMFVAGEDEKSVFLLHIQKIEP